MSPLLMGEPHMAAGAEHQVQLQDAPEVNLGVEVEVAGSQIARLTPMPILNAIHLGVQNLEPIALST